MCVCECVCVYVCVHERPPCDPLLPPFCMTICLSSEMSVMQVIHVMLSFFATGVDIKVIVLPAQGQGLPILKLVPYFPFTQACKCKFLPPPHCQLKSPPICSMSTPG